MLYSKERVGGILDPRSRGATTITPARPSAVRPRSSRVLESPFGDGIRRLNAIPSRLPSIYWRLFDLSGLPLLRGQLPAWLAASRRTIYRRLILQHAIFHPVTCWMRASITLVPYPVTKHSYYDMASGQVTENYMPHSWHIAWLEPILGLNIYTCNLSGNDYSNIDSTTFPVPRCQTQLR